MPPKKKKRVVNVYRDDTNNASATAVPGPAVRDDSAAIDRKSASDAFLPRAAAKRKRAAKEELEAAAPPPRIKRAALGAKPINSNSSDNSLLRSVDRPDASFKQQQGGKGSLLKNESFHTTEKENPEDASLLQDSGRPSSFISKALSQALINKDVDTICDLMRQDAAQAAADLISQKGCWTPELLNVFRSSPSLISLDLSSPAFPSGIFIPHTPPSHTLKILFQQHCFSSLTTLSLRNTPLSNDDTALLRLLPTLAVLDLCNTGITTTALYHLACHRNTLTTLNISLNTGINNTARYIIAAFPHLSALYLRGVDFDMPALRRLVGTDLAKGCRLLSVPAQCVAYLNTRHEQYVVDIPHGYTQNPTLVPPMTVPNLKRNLELHQKVNRDVQVTGTKVELVARLSAILWNRLSDTKILAVLGRP